MSFRKKLREKLNRGPGLKLLALGMGPSPLALDKDVLGARGSFRSPGNSVAHAKEKKMGEARAIEDQQRAALAAAAAAEEAAFDKQKESQKKGLLRKGRRASILTSSQGVPEPLGGNGPLGY